MIDIRRLFNLLAVMETNLQVFEIDSYVRGYHAYMDVWSPVIGETLLVKREPSNVKDRHAVAIFKEDAVVGHACSLQYCTTFLTIFKERR